MPVRRKRIRELAQQILEENEVHQPPIPLARIVATYGLLIARQSNAVSYISGILARERGRNIIGVNTSHSDERQRFTIAHELGHFFLHTQGTDEVHIDRGFDVKFRDNVSAQGSDIEEKEANLFAAELLMPYEFLKRDLAGKEKIDIVDDQLLQELAQNYEVSQQAMLIRLTQLRVLTL